MFVNTKEFSPIPKMGKFPPRDSHYWESFWLEQLRYIMNGYDVGGVHITGYHYWYLNFWIIIGLDEKLKRKTIIHPRFTDLDYEKFMVVDRMVKEQKDCLFLKSRQKGFSETFASILGCDFSLIPASQLVVVAGEEKYSERTFNNLLRGLNHLEETEFYKERNPDRNDYIMASYKELFIDEYGKRRIRSKGTMAEAYRLTAKDNPQVVSRLTPSKVVMEEIGKWQKGLVKETYEFIKPSLEAEGTKTGYVFFIGTGGDMEESVSDVEEMFYNPEKFNLLTFDNRWENDETTNTKVAFFIPSYKYEIIDENGNSLIEESRKKIMHEFESKKPAERIRAMTQKPFKPSWAFMVSDTGFFGQEVIAMLNSRRAYIHNHLEAQTEQKGRLEWNETGKPEKGVKFIPDENDWWIKIYERPKVDSEGLVYRNLYKIATDSYDQDESKTTTSKGCCVVVKGFRNVNETYNKLVAKILERPETSKGGAEVFFEHTVKICIYYGWSKNLIEWSKTRIIDYYVQHNFSNLLKERPEFVLASYIKKSLATNRYGVDPSTKPHWIAQLKDFLTQENIDKLDDLEVLTALAMYIYDPTGKKYNCDITIAMSLAAVYLEDEKKRMVMSASQMNRPNYFFAYKKDHAGNIVISH